ncbi:MAG: hypothetical protein M3Q93_00680 [Gemmatimonadota bacterium]|nr:hypothetical protein [Gemmatimonadota bacterium]
MKTLWILAAAVTFAACANRSEEDTGAAPDQGDSTMVQADTTVAPSPSTSGYDTTSTTIPADTAMTADTTLNPSTGASGYDTTSTTESQNPPSGQTGYDTTSTTGVGTDTTSMSPSSDSTMSDSAGMDSSTESMQGDSVLTNTDSTTTPQ